MRALVSPARARETTTMPNKSRATTSAGRLKNVTGSVAARLTAVIPPFSCCGAVVVWAAEPLRHQAHRPPQKPARQRVSQLPVYAAAGGRAAASLLQALREQQPQRA